MSSTSTDRRQGLSPNIGIKAPVQCASTAALALPLQGLLVIDGYQTLSVDTTGYPSRVLYKDDANPANNGIWDVSAGLWTRSVDSDAIYDFAQGTQVTVVNGAQNSGLTYQVSSPNPNVPGSNSLAFKLFGNGGVAILQFLAAGAGAIYRFLQDKLRDTVSPKDYGAKGDGVTNDSVSIQNAINYLGGLGGGVLTFPRGVYLCNIVLASGVTLAGMVGNQGYIAGGGGISAVTLKQAAAGPVVDTPAGATTSAGIVGINVQGTASGATNIGVRFQNTYRCFVKQSNIDNFNDQAVLKSLGYANVFEDILTTNCLLNRARAQVNGTIESYGSDDFFHRIEASAGLVNAVTSANLYVCGIALFGGTHFMSSCIGEFSDRGIYVDAQGCMITGSRADHNMGYGFFFDSQAGSSVVSGCLALANSLALTNTYDGFYFNQVAACQVSSCSSYSNSAPYQRYGFYDGTNGSVPTQRNTFVACSGVGNASGLYYIAPFQGSGVIDPPTLARFAANVTTPDFTGTVVGQTANAAATTITNFLGGTDGKTIRLICADVNTTVANNGTIVTNTAANKALTNQKVYRFTLSNGVWYEDA